MFCTECGKENQDGSMQCSSCGHLFVKDEIVMNIEMENSDEYSDAVADDTIYSEQEYQYDSDATYDDAESSLSTDNSGFKKIRIALVVIVAVILLIVAGVKIYDVAYKNSDEYKIKKAAGMIYNSDIIGGVELLSDIYTPQAITIKSFAEVENARIQFDEKVKSQSFSAICDAYKVFEKKLNEFEEDNSVHYLTTDLKRHYNSYRTAFDCINETVPDVSQDLYDIQLVMLNEVQRNNSSENGASFRLRDLQSNIDQSNAALKKLQEFFNLEVLYGNVKIDVGHVYNIESHCYVNHSTTDTGENILCVHTGDFVSEVIKDIIVNCRNEISESQENIDNSLKKFDLDDDLYMTKPEANYSSFVSWNLANIKSVDDIIANRDKIIKHLQNDMLCELVIANLHEYDASFN